jgi:subtilisin family serine protease
VDLAAPGCNLAQAVDRTVRDFCGTSSAAPFAAGVAALALAADPTATAATLRAVLTATADPVTGGWVASGRVNAHAAVSAMPWSGTRDNTAPSVRFNKAPRHGFKHIRGTVRVTAKASDASGVKRVDLLVDGRVIGTETGAPYTFRVRSWRYGSSLKAQLRAYDRAGNVRYTSVRVWYR